jgi:hypothetical protein
MYADEFVNTTFYLFLWGNDQPENEILDPFNPQ